jgi:hypothetical protein
LDCDLAIVSIHGMRLINKGLKTIVVTIARTPCRMIRDLLPQVLNISYPYVPRFL